MIPTTPFFQVSWVVRDLEESIHRWMRMANIGPFFLNAHVEVGSPRYRGSPTKFDHSLALCQAGSLQLELIEQHDDIASVYRDVGDPGPNGKFHHMGCFVPDAEAEFARYAALGAPLVYDGYFGTMRLGYIDTREQLGYMVEVLEHDPVVEKLFKAIADAAVDWDGRDPIRPLPAL